MKTKLTKFQISALCVSSLLTLFCIIETILHIGADVPKIKTVFVCLSYVAIIYYAVYGYKIPHGNSLKYIILFFALILVNALTLEAAGKYKELVQDKNTISALTTGLSIVIVSYVAGRLHKFNRNIYLCALVLVLLIIRAISMSYFKSLMYLDISDAIIWMDIVCAYGIRFNQHKEAGLQTK